MNDISIRTQKVLDESRKAILQAPEKYRKELCESIKTKLTDPDSDEFRHDSCAVIHAFHRTYTLYKSLCDVEKAQFIDAFSELASEFEA